MQWIGGSGFRGSGFRGSEFKGSEFKGSEFKGSGEILFRHYRFWAAQRDAWTRLGTLIFLNIL